MRHNFVYHRRTNLTEQHAFSRLQGTQNGIYLIQIEGRIEGTDDEEGDISSYWMILGKREESES
jgi:hypothetical protein